MSAPDKFPCVLGFPMEEAMRRLHDAGAVVTKEGIFSKKGVAGAADLRVIRQREEGDAVHLTYSAFITEIEEHTHDNG